MRRAEVGRAIRRGGAVFTALTLGALAAGCSTDRLFGSDQTTASSPNAPSTSRSVMDTLLQKPPEPSEEEKRAAVRSVAEMACPDVDVRQGTSTLQVPPNNAEPLALRYQGSLGDFARECKVTGGIMHMKVGIEGRLLLGPAGTPGQVEVPIRYAVVREGAEPRTVLSKLARIQVAIPEGQQNVIFTHVEPDVAFPMPPGIEIDAYVVYVGFDPGAAQTSAKKPPQKPTRR